MNKQESAMSTIEIDTPAGQLVAQYMSVTNEMNANMVCMRDHAVNIARSANTIIDHLDTSFRTDIGFIQSYASNYMTLQTRLEEQAKMFRLLEKLIRDTVDNGETILAQCKEERINGGFLFIA
jgi:hypothetical protein